MKKVFLAIAVASVFTACNNGGETPAAKDSTTVVTKDTTTVVTKDTTVAPVMKDTTAAKKDTTKKM